jgi:hypothetical protein
MRSLAARRWRNLGVFALLAAVVLALSAILSFSIYPTSFASGWMLWGLILALAAYNVRKRLTFLPLGSSSKWLQAHIYGGFLSFVLFAVHVEFRLPNAPFEMTLTVLYFIVFFSGLGGLAISRAIPARLTTRGEEVLFERIPKFTKRIRDDVEQIVLGCISETQTTAIPEFYIDRLKPFFGGPRNFWQHLFQSSRPRNDLLEEIRSHERFLNKNERAAVQRIVDLICAKDDLDHQYALQWTLKVWLFAHIPFTYALIIFSVFHLVLVHAFAGGPNDRPAAGIQLS